MKERKTTHAEVHGDEEAEEVEDAQHAGPDQRVADPQHGLLHRRRLDGLAVRGALVVELAPRLGGWWVGLNEICAATPMSTPPPPFPSLPFPRLKRKAEAHHAPSHSESPAPPAPARAPRTSRPPRPPWSRRPAAGRRAPCRPSGGGGSLCGVCVWTCLGIQTDRQIDRWSIQQPGLIGPQRTLGDVEKVKGAGRHEHERGDAEGGAPEVAEEVRDGHLPE